MDFHSWIFLLFLPAILVGHHLLRGVALRCFLVAGSYLFYGWADPWVVSLLVLSTCLDFLVALRIGASKSPRAKKAWLLASVFGNLGVLAFFKYSGMLLRWGAALGLPIEPALVIEANALPLPIGISFYTFQTLSYTIDVYRGRLEPRKDFSVVALYVAFFPQLVAGPIERATHLLPQLETKQERTPQDLKDGITRVLWGFSKKLIFADWFGRYVQYSWTNPENCSPLELLIGLHAFSFQIYLDFSAYSDIAIGLARLMGIRLRENFRWPFLSRNPIEFWTRWHISLTTWIRDYVYVPLGGNRVGELRMHFNNLLVMLLIGLWHGADEKFVVWGLCHWLYDTAYRIYRKFRPGDWHRDKPYSWRDSPAILATYCLVVPQVFFGAPTLDHAWRILKRVVSGDWSAEFYNPATEVVIVCVLLAIAMGMHVVRGLRLDTRLYALRERQLVLGAFWGAMLIGIVLFHAPSHPPFYYFRF